ncbi:hypothetical protein LPJ57_009563, partial [Coemansia sp. RSA 486]
MADSSPMSAQPENHDESRHSEAGNRLSQSPLHSQAHSAASSDNEEEEETPMPVNVNVNADENPTTDDDPTADYASDETSIELMHSRLDTLADLDLGRFRQLEYLGCRQNLLADLQPLSAL